MTNADARALDWFDEEARALRAGGYVLRSDQGAWQAVATVALQDLVVEHQKIRHGEAPTKPISTGGVFTTVDNFRPSKDAPELAVGGVFTADALELAAPRIPVPAFHDVSNAPGLLRVLSLPGGIRLPVRRDCLLDIRAQDLLAHFSRQRPWRVRRGIFVLRAAVHWLNGLQ